MHPSTGGGHCSNLPWAWRSPASGLPLSSCSTSMFWSSPQLCGQLASSVSATSLSASSRTTKQCGSRSDHFALAPCHCIWSLSPSFSNFKPRWLFVQRAANSHVPQWCRWLPEPVRAPEHRVDPSVFNFPHCLPLGAGSGSRPHGLPYEYHLLRGVSPFLHPGALAVYCQSLGCKSGTCTAPSISSLRLPWFLNCCTWSCLAIASSLWYSRGALTSSGFCLWIFLNEEVIRLPSSLLRYQGWNFCKPTNTLRSNF